MSDLLCEFVFNRIFGGGLDSFKVRICKEMKGKRNTMKQANRKKQRQAKKGNETRRKVVEEEDKRGMKGS